MNPQVYHCLNKLFFSHQTTILMYHGFTTGEPAEAAANYHGKHLHVDLFQAQLEHLQRYYHVMALDNFVDHCLDHRPIPGNAVVLTLDDGYESNFTLGFPLLKKYNMPASIFLATDFMERKNFIWGNRIEFSILQTPRTCVEIRIHEKPLTLDLTSLAARHQSIHQLKEILKPLTDKNRATVINQLEDLLGKRLTFDSSIPALHRPLQWEQIKEMITSGLVSIGAHTCNHGYLAQTPHDLMEEEIINSKKCIEQNLNRACDMFCYPYGDVSTFNVQTTESLRKAGFRCALTTISGTNNRSSDLFSLKRYGTSNHLDMEHFQNTLLHSRRLIRRFRDKFLHLH